MIGGGYIAAELGHFFGTFGSDVTIVGRRPHLLPDADREVAAAFTERYADRFAVHAGHEATAVSESDGSITVETRPYPPAFDGDPDETGTTVTGDEVLVAAGRVPNTDTLDVAAAGVETDDQGFVETDEFLRTSAEGVWALGDIVGEYLLILSAITSWRYSAPRGADTAHGLIADSIKHNANHEARTVAGNLLRDDLEPVDYSAIPFAVFASPEVAGVGATEGELQETDREYATNTYRYEDTARGDAMNEEGLVKVIIHPALSEVVDRAFSGRFSRPGDHHTHDH